MDYDAKFGQKWVVTILVIINRHSARGFIGWLAKDVAYLSWLNYGQQFGFSEPFHLNLGILKITFGLTIKITMSSIIGVVLAIIVYKKL